MPEIIVLTLLVLALVFWIKSVQRSLSVLNKNIDNTVSQIDIQLSSLWNCLTPLLALAREYDTHNCDAYADAIKARHTLTTNSTPEDMKKQEKFLTEVVGEIAAVGERCPDLKSNQTYIKAMDAVSQHEKMIDTSRLIYNESAERLNQAIRKFPSSIVAGMLGFSKQDLFK